MTRLLLCAVLLAWVPMTMTDVAARRSSSETRHSSQSSSSSDSTDSRDLNGSSQSRHSRHLNHSSRSNYSGDSAHSDDSSSHANGSHRAATATAPRIWLTPAVLAAVRAKADAGDRDWQRLKTRADELLTRRMPRFTVTGATNGNPVTFTIAEEVPWSDTTPVFIAGATGAWSAVNAKGDRPRPIAATRVDAHTFTVPIDSTSFGSFGVGGVGSVGSVGSFTGPGQGQRLALFFSTGGYSEYGYNGLDWQSTLETLSLAYQVTGKRAYASKAIELVSYIASLGVAGMVAPVAIDSGFPTRSAIYGLAIAYDWLGDQMTAAERAAIIQTINLWFDWFTRAAFENNGPGYGNYFGGHILGFGLAGLATEFENPRGPEIVAAIRDRVKAHLAPAFESGGFAGGYPVEGYAYGGNNFQRLLSYMLAVETSTEAGIDANNVSLSYARKIARHLLHALKPNGWQVSDEGAWAGDYTGVLQPALPIVLSAVLAGTDEGRWMQHLALHLPAAPNGGQTSDAFVRLLFFDRTRPAADHRLTQPTWFHSPGDEHFYRRSSWRLDAVWTSIAGGAAHFAGHQMRGAGHVAIQRGADYLLVNSGQWKGATGDFGTPRAFDLRSWRANTLFVDDFGDYLFTGADYIGGQGAWGESRVLAHGGGADFVYLKTDLTSAYSVGDRKPWDSRSVRHFHRSFLSMGNGIVLLFDRMRFLKANYVKKLYFHLTPAGGPPAISDSDSSGSDSGSGSGSGAGVGASAGTGDTASIRSGASALFIRTLMPASPVLAVAPDPVNASDSRPITWRLEVSDSTEATTFDALNVLIATAASTTVMPDTVRVQSVNDTMVGAMVDDGGVCRIGLFSADGTPRAAVSYNANPASQTNHRNLQSRPNDATQTNLANRASERPCVHVIADLLAETEYEVARDGVSLGTVLASRAGVATFQSAAGGLFTVNKANSVKR